MSKSKGKKSKPNPHQNPCNCQPTDDQRAQAHVVLGDPSKLAVRYVRVDPRIKYVRNAEGKRALVSDPGHIGACLVGFELDGEIRVGWSCRISDEDLVPSKKSALYTAILRGICDGIQKEDGKAHVSSTSEKVLPGRIISELGTFTARLKKYFQRDISNYDIPAKAQEASA